MQVNQVKPLFNGDEATFVDRDDAVSELSPIVDYLLEHPDYTVILAGTTATAGTNEQCKELSLRRAEAVRQLMIDMGTSETQIKHVIGLGYDHEFHVEDLNADGSLNEKNAPENMSRAGYRNLYGSCSDFGEILYRIKWYNAIRFVGNSSDIVNVTVTRKISKD